MLMSDGFIGHIKEKLLVPEKVEVRNRKKPSRRDTTPWGTKDIDGVPPMPKFGEGYRLLVTGSTHRPDGVRDFSPRYHQKLVCRMRDKILHAEPKLRDIHKESIADAEIVVISFGATARPCFEAVQKARCDGIKAGFFRLRTLWPFPEEEVGDMAQRVDSIIVVEMNFGKLVKEVERVAHGNCQVVSLGKVGGVLPLASEVYDRIRGLKS
jgi:2-oxoglutarate ferredoxin oxidoreductase subunit alpha